MDLQTPERCFAIFSHIPYRAIPSRQHTASYMFPASHVCLAIAQSLASATLTKVEDILSEEAMAISGLGGNMASTTCKHNCPSVGSIIATITELNPGMTTTLKHLKSHEMPSTTKILGCFPIAPAMQPVVVDRITVVHPQLAAIIGDDAKPVMSCLEDSEATCPTHGEVICSGKTGPSATCVAVVDILMGPIWNRFIRWRSARSACNRKAIENPL